jgi:hypothetical protein
LPFDSIARYRERSMSVAGENTVGSWHVRIRRLGLGALTALVSVNVWTGSPLLAVWLGSRVQRLSGSPSMAAIAVVLLALGVQSLLLLRLLAALNRSYDALLGRQAERWNAPWLRSMRAERADLVAHKRPLSTVERLVIASVVAAVCAFEVWFFFFAGSSLPNA